MASLGAVSHRFIFLIFIKIKINPVSVSKYLLIIRHPEFYFHWKIFYTIISHVSHGSVGKSLSDSFENWILFSIHLLYMFSSFYNIYSRMSVTNLSYVGFISSLLFPFQFNLNVTSDLQAYLETTTRLEGLP